MKKFIEKEIEDRKKIYSIKHHQIRSDYNIEVEHMESYRGRELLELLQNADDELNEELPKEVKISFSNKQLTISNFGNPFNEDGIISLMYSNNSSKKNRKRKVIGNKGTGFRSILGWAEKITINSGSLHIEFSDVQAQNTLKDALGEEIVKKEKLKAATLVFPKWNENYEESKYTTDITITVKDDKNIIADIKEQLSAINEELLLFLNNTQKIVIEQDSEITILERKDENDKTIIYTTHNEVQTKEEWKINKIEETLVEKGEEKSFSVATAYKLSGELPKNQVIYSYFPTEVSFPLPFLVHGNFNLSENRNTLKKKDNVNVKILDYVIVLTIQTMKELYSKEVNYDCLYRLLFMKDLHSDLNNYGFKEKLINTLPDYEVFPTVNKKYVSLKVKPKFYEEPLAKHLSGKEFEDLLQAFDENDLKSRYEDVNPYYSASDFKDTFKELFPYEEYYEYNEEELVDKISSWLLRIKKPNKANMKKVAETAINYHEHFGLRYVMEEKVPAFAFDKDGSIITDDVPIFIQKDEIKFTTLPRFAHIEFLNEYEGDALLELSEDGNFDWMHVSEITCHTIVDGIDERINNLIVEDNIKKASDFAETSLKWLWANRKKLQEEAETEGGYTTYILDRKGVVNLSTELAAGKEYDNGWLERLYSWENDSRWVCNIKDYIGEVDTNEAIAFLKMINVEFMPEWSDEERRIFDDGYRKELFKQLSYPYHLEGGPVLRKVSDWDDVYVSSITISPVYYDAFENILQNAETQYILEWIQRDETLRDLLISGKELTMQSLKVVWGNNRNPKPIYLKSRPISYMYYLFKTIPWIKVGENKYRIDDCLLSEEIGDKIAPILVCPDIDFYIKDIEGNRIKLKNDYVALMGQLSIKTSFEELPIEKIYEVFNSLNKLNVPGEMARSLYRQFINSGIRITDGIDSIEEYQNFIDKGYVYTNNGYVKAREAFYLDGKDICEKIATKFNLIDLPRRMNRDRIEKYLGVKRLDLTAKLLQEPVINTVNDRFQSDFESFKPLAFCYRIDAKKDVEVQARKYSKLNIILCDEVYADYSKGPEFLDDYEYLLSEDGYTYYLKVPSDLTERNLKHNLDMSKAVANIITSYLDVYEILSKVRELYYLWDKSSRENIILEELEDTSIIDRARRALNYNKGLKEEFIKIIENISDVPKEAYIMDVNDLDFEDFQSIANINVLRKCFKHAKIDFEDYNSSNPSVKINYKSYFERQVEDLLPLFRDKYKAKKYIELKEKTLEEKTNLVNEILEYDALVIPVNNSVYFNPESTIKEYLQIEDTDVQLDLKEIYFKNLEIFKQQIENDEYIEDFTNIPENQSLIYYEEYAELKSRYNEYLKKYQKEDHKEIDDEQTRSIDIKVIKPETLPKHVINETIRTGSRLTTGFSKKQTKTDQAHVGLKGEKYVYEKLLKNPLIKKVTWRSENAKKAKINPEGVAGLGYDIEIIDANDKVRYIEVKATKAGSNAGIRFFMSDNEYKFACEHNTDYEIYYVCDVNGNEPTILILDNVFEGGEFNVNQYSLFSETEYTITAEVIDK